MEIPVWTAVCDGVEPTLVQVEAARTKGYCGLSVLSNAAESLREGKERAKSALEAAGFKFPAIRIVLNLTPADIRKQGCHFDLPMAMALTQVISGKSPLCPWDKLVFAAELRLDGSLVPVKNIISFALAAVSRGLNGMVIAEDNQRELMALKNHGGKAFQKLQIYGFKSLTQVLDWAFEGNAPRPTPQTAQPAPPVKVGPDFDDMLLDPATKRAAMVCAAGLHSMLLRGCPGVGKSMLARRLPSILPKMATSAHITSMKIHSMVYERLPDSLLRGTPVLRSPHHGASAAAIVGTTDQPGDLSLAHGGVLFLDELPEFRKDLIEALREPLENGVIHVSRSKKKVAWQSEMLLVAACNNCPCGWHGSRTRVCSCPISKIQSYGRRMSGPIQDRIDIHVNMPEPSHHAGSFLGQMTSLAGQTNQMAQVVEEARQRAAHRNKAWQVEVNRDLPTKSLEGASGMGSETFRKALSSAIQGTPSNRALARAVRVARTIADMDGRPVMEKEDLCAAWEFQAQAAAKARGDHALGIS